MAKRSTGNGVSQAEETTHHDPHTVLDGEPSDSDLTSKMVTVGVIGLGVALFEASLIPGMIIGVAAALMPSYVPKVGNGLRPLIKSTVRGAYKLAQATREAVSEAGEQIQDLVAEAQLEEKQASAHKGQRATGSAKS